MIFHSIKCLRSRFRKHKTIHKNSAKAKRTIEKLWIKFVCDSSKYINKKKNIANDIQWQLQLNEIILFLIEIRLIEIKMQKNKNEL